LRGDVDHLDADGHHPIAQHGNLLRRGEAQVDDAVAHVGAAVVDAHRDLLAVAQVAHQHHRAEAKRAVGRGQRVHVETFAAGGDGAMFAAPVVAGLPQLHLLCHLCSAGDPD
jgi:hypothetical protein